jgi:hypothetical protein
LGGFVPPRSLFTEPPPFCNRRTVVSLNYSQKLAGSRRAAVLARKIPVPKKIRIPAKRADRSVRWTLEVSADTRKTKSGAPGATAKRKATSRRTTARKSSRRLSAPRDTKPVAKKKALQAKTAQPAPAMTRPAMTRLDPRAPVRLRPSVLAMAAGAVVVVVMLVLTRDTSLRASAAVNGDSDLQASGDVAVVQPALRVAPAPRAAEPVAAAPGRPPAPAPTVDKPTRMEVAPNPTSVPANSAPLRPAPVTMLARVEEPAVRATAVDSNSSPVESNLAADRTGQAPVTITGCLEVTTEGDQFRLTDAEGEAAPKSRGWRSGFLRKRSAAIELSGLGDAASVRRYVGHRVVATGLLASRELRVRSLQSAGAVCD